MLDKSESEERVGSGSSGSRAGSPSQGGSRLGPLKPAIRGLPFAEQTAVLSAGLGGTAGPMLGAGEMLSPLGLGPGKASDDLVDAAAPDEAQESGLSGGEASEADDDQVTASEPEKRKSGGEARQDHGAVRVIRESTDLKTLKAKAKRHIRANLDKLAGAGTSRLDGVAQLRAFYRDAPGLDQKDREAYLAALPDEEVRLRQEAAALAPAFAAALTSVAIETLERMAEGADVRALTRALERQTDGAARSYCETAPLSEVKAGVRLQLMRSRREVLDVEASLAGLRDEASKVSMTELAYVTSQSNPVTARAARLAKLLPGRAEAFSRLAELSAARFDAAVEEHLLGLLEDRVGSLAERAVQLAQPVKEPKAFSADEAKEFADIMQQAAEAGLESVVVAKIRAAEVEFMAERYEDVEAVAIMHAEYMKTEWPAEYQVIRGLLHAGQWRASGDSEDLHRRIDSACATLMKASYMVSQGDVAKVEHLNGYLRAVNGVIVSYLGSMRRPHWAALRGGR